MPAAAHGYFHAVSAGEPDGLHDVALTRDLHNHLRVARRGQLVPNHPAPEVLIIGVRRGRHRSVDATLQFSNIHDVLTPSVDQTTIEGRKGPLGSLYRPVLIRVMGWTTRSPFSKHQRRRSVLRVGNRNPGPGKSGADRKSTRLNSSHSQISYA